MLQRPAEVQRGSLVLAKEVVEDAKVVQQLQLVPVCSMRMNSMAKQ